MDKNMKLSPPWIEFYHEVEALFAEDPDVKVIYNEESNDLKLYVKGADKADALGRLLPEEKVFGNVTVKITVIPSNDETETIGRLFEKAFFGNGAMNYTYEADSVLGRFTYVVFKKKVVQFFNDQLDDINGVKSTLYQDIARDVFGDKHAIYFCTDTNDPKLAKPLGEWP